MNDPDNNLRDPAELMKALREKFADDGADDLGAQAMQYALNQDSAVPFADGVLGTRRIAEEKISPHRWGQVLRTEIKPLLEQIANVCEREEMPYLFLAQTMPEYTHSDGRVVNNSTQLAASMYFPDQGTSLVLTHIIDLISGGGKEM